MKRKNAIWDLIDDIQTETGLTTDGEVRTVGGDQDIDPPEVILEWRSPRLQQYNGANSLGGFTTDQSGDQTGREYHRYYRMQVDCIARSYDEEEMHDILTNIQNGLAKYEYDASLFDADTSEWDVGDLSPRNNPVVEPDWYESGVMVEFNLLEKSTETADAIETINREDTDDYIDISLEDGDVSVGD